nr:hypothetical protein [Tanacetum cinerariifolium]
KKDSVPVPADEEPIQKGKRVKRSAKKSSTTQTTGIVIREPPVETQSKRKEKSLRDFHKSHPSGPSSVAEKPPSVEKITPPITSEGTGDKPRVPDVTKDESTESESESWGNDKDDCNNKEGNDDDEDDDNDDDKSEGDEDRGIDIDDVHDEKADVRMTDAQQEKENLEITQEQVIEDAHVIITKKTEVPITSSSRSSDLASKFLKFSDIPPADIEIVSPLDVHVHHEVPRIYTSTLLAIPVSIIPKASLVYLNIPQSSQTFTSPPLHSTPSPLPTTKTTNIPSSTPYFALVFRFNDIVIALEKDVVELKNDPLHTQVIVLVDDHLDTRMGATKEEFMNFLSASLTDRITEQVINHLPQILSEEVSNFTLPAAATLTEFELKNILIDKKNSSESYLTAPEHQECYDGLIKSYNLDKDLFSSYDVYSLKRSRDEKDKDEGPFAGSDRGLKNQKTSKDAAPTTSLKTKDSSSRSSKGTKSQPKSSGKSVRAEEPVFDVGDTNTPQGQERNQDKTPQKGPTQNWLMILATSTSTGKLLKEFDELISTLIDFSSYILNGLKIRNLTQEILLGPTFRLLKGTRLNYAELEYDFKECYKALSEKLDWENLKGGDYLFDLSKPLPLIMRGNRQSVLVEFFINNDLKYLQGGISTMTYTTSTTKTKVSQYDLPGIKNMTFYAYVRGIQSRGDVYSTKRILALTHVSIMRKHGYGYLEEIVVRRADNALYKFKEGDFPRLRINDIEDMLLLVVQNWLTNLLRDDVADFTIALKMFTRSLVIQKRVEDLQLGVESYQKQINVTKPDTTRPDLRKIHPHNPYKNPQGFIYVNDYQRNRLMRFDELYKFSDGTLTRLLSSLEDITKNIDMEYLPKRRWSTLEKKRAHYMIKDINKLLKERRMMRSLEKFVGGGLYKTDLRLL